MNVSTLFGVLVSLTLLIIVVAFTAEDASIFFNGPGFAIVVFGTLAATLTSYPIWELLRVSRMVAIVFQKEEKVWDKQVNEIIRISELNKTGTIREIEDVIDTIRNPFFKTGIQLVIDGTKTDDLINLMEWRIARLQAKEQADSQIFHTMSHYAPAFGMLGTLVGLVNMFYSVGINDLSLVGHYMAVALMTTLYGILLANLIFKPIALKLERRTERRVILMNMILEGVLMVKEKRSPSFLRQALLSFSAQYKDELTDDALVGVKKPMKKATA